MPHLPKVVFNCEAAFDAFERRDYGELERQLSLLRPTDNSRELGVYYYLQSRLWARNGDVGKAETLLLDSKAVWLNVDLIWAARCELRLALDKLSAGNITGADLHFETSVRILENDPSANARAFLSIAYFDFSLSLCHHIEQLQRATTFAKKAVQLSLELGFTLRIIRSCSNVLQIAQRSGLVSGTSLFVELGIKYIGLLVDTDPSLGAPDVVLKPNGISVQQRAVEEDVLQFYVNAGSFRLMCGQTELALDLCTKARDIALRTQNERVIAAITNHLAAIHEQLGNFDAAEALLLQVVEYYKVGDAPRHDLFVQLRNLASIKSLKSEFHESLNIYNRIRVDFSPFEDPADEALLLFSIGETYRHTGAFTQAITNTEDALKIAQAYGLRAIATGCFRLLGVCHMHTDTALAKQFLTQSLVLANDFGLVNEARDIHLELSRYHKLLGNTADAMVHLESHIKLKEELFNQKVADRIARLSALHEAEMIRAQFSSYEVKFGQVSEALKDAVSKFSEKDKEVQQLSQELGYMAAQFGSNREVLAEVEHGIQKILLNNPELKDPALRSLLQNVKAHTRSIDDLYNFGELFSKAHGGFMSRIKTLAPDVSSAELKVCVLISMSLPSKTIAQLLNINSRTIENHRTAIRRKLGLEHDVSLSGYLLSLR